MACSRTFSVALKLEVQGYEVGRCELVRFMRERPEKQAHIFVDANQDYHTKYRFVEGLFRLQLHIADVLESSEP
jgi:hypothetical protein